MPKRSSGTRVTFVLTEDDILRVKVASSIEDRTMSGVIRRLVRTLPDVVVNPDNGDMMQVYVGEKKR